MSEAREEFVSEAEDLLRETEDGLLDLQETLSKGCNPDVLNGVFRSIHTLKGLSGLFGQRGILDLSHAMETMLDELRLGQRELTEATIAFLLKNLDILKKLLGEIFKEGKELTSVDAALEEIGKFRDEGKGREKEVKNEPGCLTGIPEEITKVLSEYEEHRLRTALKKELCLVTVEAEFELVSFEEDLKGLIEKINQLGELIATIPKTLGVLPGRIGFDLLVALNTSLSKAKEALKLWSVNELVPSPPEPETTSSILPAVNIPTKPGEEIIQEPLLKSGSSTVRVDIGKIDAILDTVGELMLAKGAVSRIGAEISETFGFGPFSVDLQKVSRILEKRLEELQNQILEIRMVPVRQVFSRLNRVVRRYTRDKGKEIDLQLFGGETEVDKLMAEEIIDPLMHMMRNAIDHGIEPAEERLAAGKPVTGVITLKAFPKGNHVVFQLTDDGYGIQPEKVLAKAREKKLIAENQTLDHDGIVKLIFLPGFSTASSVNDVSGRGVGMDVVKEKVSSLGGFIDVETEPGCKTTFTVTIPITLAIIKAVLVSTAGETMAVPMASTSETLSIEPDMIQHIEGKEVIELRGKMLPIVRLAEMFWLYHDRPRERYFVVVVGFGGRRIGLLVDSLLGQQEIVVKPLGERLEKIKGISGAAEIGKYKVILVLDVESLMEEAMLSSQTIKADSDGLGA